MTDFAAILAKLEAWREFDFHPDRELADEILIATGWQVAPDPTFAGGIRWFIGQNPTYSLGEPHRPHPIHDVAAAIACIRPDRGYVIGRGRLRSDEPLYGARVTAMGDPDVVFGEGESNELTVAILIAAMKDRASA